MERELKGITVAGNVIVDVVKTIDCYPKLGMLSNISSVSRAVGGCAPNTAIDLAKIDGSLKLSVVGKVGNDEYGSFVISKLRDNGIDTKNIAVTENAPTSFSDVMSLSSGDRTFFHARGANALFSPNDITVTELDCKIFHIGYILLLDIFDMEDEEYGTAMARLLSEVQGLGIKTSIDAVSDSSGDFPKKLKPALKYTDYCILNEVECCNIWGLEPYKGNGELDVNAVKEAMTLTLNAGVREKVIVHCKKSGFCLNKNRKFTAIASLNIPKEEIKGSVGAGDAFCAGSLYGIYKGFKDAEILEFASAAAACNLFSENSVDGMKCYEEIIKMPKKYGRLFEI